jgi:hypothetical protein
MRTGTSRRRTPKNTPLHPRAHLVLERLPPTPNTRVIRRPSRIILTDYEVCRVSVEHALSRQVEQSVTPTPAAPFRMVYRPAVQTILHGVQEARRVAFHDERDVWVERAERADLKIALDVSVVYERRVCAADVLGCVVSGLLWLWCFRRFNKRSSRRNLLYSH